MENEVAQYRLTKEERKELSKHLKRKEFWRSYSDEFKDYLYVFGCHKNWTFVKKAFVPTIIIALLVFVANLFLKFVDVNPIGFLFMLLEIAMGALLTLLIVRPVVAYTYGIILSFIGFPIYKIAYSVIERRILKKENYLAKEWAEKIVTQLPESYRPYQKEIVDKCMYYRSKRALPYVINDVAMVSAINSNKEDAADDQPILETIKSLTVFKAGIVIEENAYSFEENRFKNLSGAVEQLAVALALASSVVLGGLEDGCKYGVEVDCSDEFEDLDSAEEDSVTISFIYKEKNYAYRALRSL